MENYNSTHLLKSLLEATAVGDEVGNGAAEKEDDEDGGDDQCGEHADDEDGEDDAAVRGESVVENVDQQLVQEWEEDVLDILNHRKNCECCSVSQLIVM